ncbi:MAG: helix-turn-helix transcriptional regulator [Flavobacteriales bacterium]|nr:helix-turn-helix transcriptional regulator [Flavobacteriales bacterium]
MASHHHDLNQLLQRRVALAMDVVRILPGQWCYVYHGREGRIVQARGFVSSSDTQEDGLIPMVSAHSDDGWALKRLNTMMAEPITGFHPSHVASLVLTTRCRIDNVDGGKTCVLRRVMACEIDVVAGGIASTLTMCMDISRLAWHDQMALLPRPAAGSSEGLSYRPSCREMEVIRELVKGRSSKQIAVSLNISLHTVNAHRRNLLARTGSENAVQLVRHAAEQGWI